MKERERIDMNESRTEIFERDNHKCQYPIIGNTICGKPACQLAHRIAKPRQSKKGNHRMVVRIAKELSGGIEFDSLSILDHRFNLISSCDNLAHNSYFNIGFNREAVKLLIGRIVKDLINEE